MCVVSGEANWRAIRQRYVSTALWHTHTHTRLDGGLESEMTEISTTIVGKKKPTKETNEFVLIFVARVDVSSERFNAAAVVFLIPFL